MDMEGTWKSSMDRMLQSTEATLEQLQNRRVTYDRAKRKVEDYLDTPLRSVGSKLLQDGMEHDMDIPPPLPQHLRYRIGGGLGDVSRLPSMPCSSNFPTPARPTKMFTPAEPRQANATASSPSSSLHLVQEQVRGTLLELELEKAKRADSIRELSYSTTSQLAELRSLITQLQMENETLKKSMRALEDRAHVTGIGNGSQKGILDGTGNILAEGAAVALASYTGTGTEADRDAALNSAAAAVSLAARVGALEASLARQQVTEDRQNRTISTIRELVKTEVASGMSQVRSLAREAARDCAEDLLKLRLAGLHSGMQTDIQKALSAASSSDLTAQDAQRQCSESERRISAQLHRLQTQLADWQERSSTAAASSLLSSNPREQERQHALERRVEEQQQRYQDFMRQYRTDVEANADRMAQQHKTLVNQVQPKADAAEVFALRKELEELRKSCGGGVTLDQVSLYLHSQLQSYANDIHKAQAVAAERLDSNDSWRQQVGVRFAAVEAGLKEAQAEAEHQDQLWQSSTREVQHIRDEMNGTHVRLSDSVRQAKADLAGICDSRVQSLEERLQLAQRERLSDEEVEQRKLQASLAEHQELFQRLSAQSGALEERLQRMEGGLRTLETTNLNAVEEFKAKHDAMRNALQETCVLPLSLLHRDLATLQRRLEEAEEEKARLNASWSLQLANAKEFQEERMRHMREVLEQRVAHIKDLHDEMRAQQVVRWQLLEDNAHTFADAAPSGRTQRQQRQPPETAAMASPVSTETTPIEAERSSEPASSPCRVAGSSLLDELQPRVSLLADKLEEVHYRIDSLEAGTARAQSDSAQSVASVDRRLGVLQERLHAEAEEQRRRQLEWEHCINEKVDTLFHKNTETAASVETQHSRQATKLEEALSPLPLATRLASDPACVQYLAARFQEYLSLPAAAATALADLQSNMKEQYRSVEHLKAALQVAQEQLVRLTTTRESDNQETTASDLGTQQQQQQQLVINSLQESYAALQGTQNAFEERVRQLQDTCLPSVAAEVGEVRTLLKNTSLDVTKLADQLEALKAVQRQQLPTLQTYVHDVVEAMQSTQSTLVEPLQLRLRATEERQKSLQAWWEDTSAAHDKEMARTVQELQKKVDETPDLLRDTVQTLTESLHEPCSSIQTTVDHLSARIAAAEEQARGWEQTIHEEVLRLLPSTTTAAKSAEVETVQLENVSAQPPAGASLSALESAMENTQAYVQEMEMRLTQLEEKTADSVTLTTETLGAFQQHLQTVVDRFAEAAATAAADERRHHNGGDTETGMRKEDQDAAESVGAEIRGDGVALAVVPLRPGPIRSLEDVLLFLLHHVYELQEALRLLQANTVETLEILEQHEENVAPLPMLQHTVSMMAAALVPLAEGLGMETGCFLPLSDQGETPAVRQQRISAIYPPSRSDSDSRTSESEEESKNG